MRWGVAQVEGGDQPCVTVQGASTPATTQVIQLHLVGNDLYQTHVHSMSVEIELKLKDIDFDLIFTVDFRSFYYSL